MYRFRPAARLGLASAAAALCALFFAVGCATPEARYKVLSFFFDGVKKPGEEAEQAPERFRNPGEEGRPMVRSDFVSVHKPYSERACEECHGSPETRARDQGSGMPLLRLSTKTDPWKSCTTCHRDPAKVGEQAAILREGAWIHGPVATGLCRNCHLPHQSMFRRLMRFERSEEACRGCHKDVPKGSGAMAGIDCARCHDPHRAASNKDLHLRGGLAGHCQTCHPLKTEDRPWLHGPLAKGNCIACHDAHGGPGSEGHVYRPLARRCLQCHEQERLPADRGCAPEETECDTCHDPHAAVKAKDLFLRERIAARLPEVHTPFGPPPEDSLRPVGAPEPEPEAAGEAEAGETGGEASGESG